MHLAYHYVRQSMYTTLVRGVGGGIHSLTVQTKLQDRVHHDWYGGMPMN